MDITQQPNKTVRTLLAAFYKWVNWGSKAECHQPTNDRAWLTNYRFSGPFLLSSNVVEFWTEIYSSQFWSLGRSRSRCQPVQCLVRAHTLVCRWCLLLCPHVVEGTSWLSRVSYHGTMALLCWPYHPLSVPPPNTIILGIRISPYRFGGGGDTFRPEQRGRGWIRRVFHPCIGALSVLSKLSKTSCQLGESFWVNFSLPKHCHFITHSQSSQLFPNVVMILIVVTIINTPVFPFYYHCHYTATFAQYFLTTSDSTTQKQWKRSTPNSLAMRDAEMAKHSLQDHTPVKLLGSPEACLRAPSTKLTLRLPFPGHWIPSLD